MQKVNLKKQYCEIHKDKISFLVNENIDSNKKDIILVHGIVSGFYFQPLGEYLASEYNVYIPDLPGFGDSETEDILNVKEHAEFLSAFINTLNIKKPILLGNSYGCQVIIHFATKYPDISPAIILAGPTVDKNARNILSQAKAFMIDSQQEPNWQRIKSVVSEYPKAGVKRLAKTVKDSLSDKPEEKLPKIEVPVLLIRGGKDPFVSKKWLEEMGELLPNATVAEIPNKGHTINTNAPKKLAEITNDFIKE